MLTRRLAPAPTHHCTYVRTGLSRFTRVARCHCISRGDARPRAASNVRAKPRRSGRHIRSVKTLEDWNTNLISFRAHPDSVRLARGHRRCASPSRSIFASHPHLQYACRALEQDVLSEALRPRFNSKRVSLSANEFPLSRAAPPSRRCRTPFHTRTPVSTPRAGTAELLALGF